MPKKQQFNLKSFQGKSSSSSANAKAAQESNDATATVNDRLNELRKLGFKDAAARKRQLAESANQRSVPPEVGSILGVPQSASPKPKTALRLRDRWRTPGPAAPKSWLSGSNTTMTSMQRASRRSADSRNRSRPKQLLRFARLTGLEDGYVDSRPPRLIHLALKSIAETFDLLGADDYPELAEIPLRLRLKLLSYIDFYGPPIDSTALQALLQGTEHIRSLDLGGLVGHCDLTVKKVSKILGRQRRETSSNSSSAVADAWDADDVPEITLAPTLELSRLSQLTHLCLSHPAPSVLWQDLLGLSKQTPQLTHLSLAYWPWPTLTPNLATAMVSNSHGPDVTAGGSDYYSAMDQSLNEPASLLRQLSGNLLCLQWLDVEGCSDWTPALAQPSIVVSQVPQASMTDDWMASSHSSPSIFTSNWKNLNHLRCGQGWFPSVEVLQSLAEQSEYLYLHHALKRLLRDHLVRENSAIAMDGPAGDPYDVQKRKTIMWVKCQIRIARACDRINGERKSQGYKLVCMDLGSRQ